MSKPGRIIRVFPRRTKATPDDELAFVGPPGLFRPEADEVHVSCAFTWDRGRAEHLARCWAQHYQTVKMGGPAFGDVGDDFEPGMYLKPGYVITSRGCPNRCKCCLVPGREGDLRTLPIRDGRDVLDNNLLACPSDHVRSVVEMLRRQRRAVRFTGGIEAVRVGKWFCTLIAGLRINAMYLAYDRPEQQAGVERAAKLLMKHNASLRAGNHKLLCYVLVGYPGDSVGEARGRIDWVKSIGVTPFAMYYLPETATGSTIPPLWHDEIFRWRSPGLMYSEKSKAKHYGR